MSYVVNWRGLDGQAGWHPVGDLQQAAGHVEHLRNVDGVTETKIFRLEEVPFELRQYFRVELAAPVEQPVSFAASLEPAPAEVPSWATVDETPEDTMAEPAVPESAEVVEHAASETMAADSSVETTVDVGGDGNGHRRGLFGR